jgi:hypothetical protein
MLAGLGYVGALVLLATSSSGDLGMALFMSAILLVISLPAINRLAAEDGLPGIKTLFVAALVLKLGGAFIRFGVAFQLYGGTADAERYHEAGKLLADQFRSFNFDLGPDSLIGTRFTEVLTGVVYSITGASRIAGFLVFAWLGYWGLVWFYRAFRIAIPEGQHRLYAYLVLFLPSLIFWPSSIGKEAWMVSTLGLVAYGAARYFTQQRGGIIRMALGLWGAAMVRPHVVVLLLAGLAVAVVFGPQRPGRNRRRSKDAFSPLVRIAVVAGIGVAFVLAMGSSAENFEVGEKRRAESLTDVRSYAEQQSEKGGSEFDAQPIRSPIDFPMGLVSVLFRPFPFEASNGQMLLSAVEGSALLLLTLKRWRLVVGAARNWRAMPYIAVAGVFIVGFVWGFSSFGNFGILVRQRVQVYPFVLAVLCCPPVLAEIEARRRPSQRRRNRASRPARDARAERNGALPRRPAPARG